jgi:hypothetical protein
MFWRSAAVNLSKTLKDKGEMGELNKEMSRQIGGE